MLTSVNCADNKIRQWPSKVILFRKKTNKWIRIWQQHSKIFYFDSDCKLILYNKAKLYFRFCYL
jgi:hypothetical protein